MAWIAQERWIVGAVKGKSISLHFISRYGRDVLIYFFSEESCPRSKGFCVVANPSQGVPE